MCISCTAQTASKELFKFGLGVTSYVIAGAAVSDPLSFGQKVIFGTIASVSSALTDFGLRRCICHSDRLHPTVRKTLRLLAGYAMAVIPTVYYYSTVRWDENSGLSFLRWTGVALPFLLASECVAIFSSKSECWESLCAKLVSQMPLNQRHEGYKSRMSGVQLATVSTVSSTQRVGETSKVSGIASNRKENSGLQSFSQSVTVIGDPEKSHRQSASELDLATRSQSSGQDKLFDGERKEGERTDLQSYFETGD
jgi:hypothetical protein